MAQIVNDDSFVSEVLNASIPVLVDFYADWCGPCQMMAPVLNKLTPEYAEKVKIVKINVDDSMDTATKYEIQGIPAFKIFKNGEVVEEFTGAKPEAQIRAILDKYNA